MLVLLCLEVVTSERRPGSHRGLTSVTVTAVT